MAIPETTPAYDRFGSTPHTLATQVPELISRSPQVRHTGPAGASEDLRCGGAAVMNGLLLEGSHAANAQALGRMAGSDPRWSRPPGFEATDEQRRAITAMGAGTMTPTQVHELQGMLQQAARAYGSLRPPPPERPAGSAEGPRAPVDRGGVNSADLAPLIRDLRRNGAMPSANEVQLRNEVSPNSSTGFHWTVTVARPNGRMARADSNNSPNGYATVGWVPADERRQASSVGGQGYEGDISSNRSSTVWRNVNPHNRGVIDARLIGSNGDFNPPTSIPNPD